MYLLTLGGRKTFNGYGEMVWALCDALVQEEKDQGTLLYVEFCEILKQIIHL